MANELDGYLRPTTLLQAVNFLLAGISSTSISSLAEQDTNTDAEIAIKRIGESMVETQSEGWVWNQDLDYEVAPDNTTGECVLPPNATRFIQTYSAATRLKRFVMRGQKLYDTVAKTYNIGATAIGDLTVILDFEEIPPQARWYIVLKACRRFTAGKIISSTAYNFTKEDEQAARLRMEQEAAEMEPEGMLDNPTVRRFRRRRATAGSTIW